MARKKNKIDKNKKRKFRKRKKSKHSKKADNKDQFDKHDSDRQDAFLALSLANRHLTRREQILELVIESGENGLTRPETAEILNCYPSDVTAEFKHLRANGKIRKLRKRRNPKTGKQCEVFIVRKDQRAGRS